MTSQVTENTETLNAAIGAYLSDCAADGLRTATINNYGLYLRQFSNFYNSTGNTSTDINTLDILKYKKHLSDRGNSQATVNAYLNGLYRFFEWSTTPEICGKKYFSINPMGDRRMIPKAKNRNHVYADLLTEEEYENIVYPKLTRRKRFGKMELRNRALIVLLLTSGLRTSELIALCPADIDEDEGIIYVPNGKGGKPRVTIYTDEAREAVDRYLASANIRPANVPDTAPLFGNCADERGQKQNGSMQWHGYSRQAIYGIVNRYMKKKTERNTIGGHDLRHACASYLLSSGVDLVDIMNMLGHASLSTTQIYAEKLQANKHIDNIRTQTAQKRRKEAFAV